MPPFSKISVSEMFPVDTTPEKFENPAVTSYFGFVFEENLDKETQDYSDTVVYKKFHFQNVSVNTKKQNRRLHISPTICGQGFRYWQLRTEVVSPETIESIERFKSLCTELMSLIFTQKEEKEDSKTDNEMATVHSRTCQVSNMIKLLCLVW